MTLLQHSPIFFLSFFLFTPLLPSLSLSLSLSFSRLQIWVERIWNLEEKKWDRLKNYFTREKTAMKKIDCMWHISPPFIQGFVMKRESQTDFLIHSELKLCINLLMRKREKERERKRERESELVREDDELWGSPMTEYVCFLLQKLLL